MKRIIFLLLICSTALQAASQTNYIQYHNLVNQANQYWHTKDYKQSLAHYQKAFDLVDYVHAINYAKAAKAAARQKKYELTKTYVIEAIKRGYPIRFLEQNSFKKFRKSAIYKHSQKELKEEEQLSMTHINVVYRRAIDSLHFIDQNMLRGNKRVIGFSLDSNKKYSDSLNFQCLLQLIDQYGFPSEQLLGFAGYRKSWVLLHHNTRLPKNHHYWPMLLDALKKGQYLPENYCWVVDQGMEQLGKPLKYYHWDVAKDIDQLSVEEKQEIDKKRHEVGMPSINRIKVDRSKGEVKNRVKW